VFLRWGESDDTPGLKLTAADQQFMRRAGQKLVRLEQAFGECRDGMLEPQRHLVSGELEDHPENNAAHIADPATKQKTYP
jgi:hypothetical protein